MSEVLKITILGTLPSLNEMINTAKRNKYAYEEMKTEAIDLVAWSAKQSLAQKMALFPRMADYEITWYCPNKRKDKDNIIAGQKFIFDGLQAIGLIKNDGWKEIGSITHHFAVDQENPRIEIEVKEA